MHCYRTTQFDGDEAAAWHATLADAHTRLKLFKDMPEARIDLFDVGTSKEELIALLTKGKPPCVEFTPLRTWALTPRGGLTEVSAGE